MTRRRRQKKPKESSSVNEAATEEQMDTGGEATPMRATDSLSIDLTMPTPTVAKVTAQFDGEPSAEDVEAEAIRIFIEEAVQTAMDALHEKFTSLDRRSRDRMNSVMAESSGRAASIEDAVEEIQTFIGDVEARLNDMAARTERTEEACGLRPSLLTATESAVARLDEMAQGGRLKASDIRGIHRTLRAAVQEERAKRQG